MKRGTPQHPKVTDLMQGLNRRRYGATGVLEMLWQFATLYTPQGDIGKYPDAAIESYMDWDGEPGEVIKALTDKHWIDPHPTHRLIVHDWPEHCEDSVHMALARKTLLFACGTRPNLGRFGKDERKHIEEAYLRLSVDQNAQQTHGTRTENALPCHAMPCHAMPSPATSGEVSANASGKKEPPESMVALVAMTITGKDIGSREAVAKYRLEAKGAKWPDRPDMTLLWKLCVQGRVESIAGVEIIPDKTKYNGEGLHVNGESIPANAITFDAIEMKGEA